MDIDDDLAKLFCYNETALQISEKTKVFLYVFLQAENRRSNFVFDILVRISWAIRPAKRTITPGFTEN